MEIRQMEYFYHVAECKSFSKAAKKLYISQPAITNSIHQLENELNVKLFIRTTKNVSLTPEGNLFLHRVKHILSEVSLSINEVKSPFKKLTIELTILIDNSIFLKSLLKMGKNHPDLCLKITKGGSKFILNDIRKGKADIGIFALPKNWNDIKAIPLFEEEVVFCTSKDHESTYNGYIDITDLKNENLICLSEDFIEQQIILDLCLNEGFLPNIICTTNEIEIVISYVENKIANTFLMKSHVINNPNISYFSFNPPIKVKYGLGWQKNKIVTNEMNLFISFIKKFNEFHSKRNMLIS